jgi:hypothetical protein
MEAHKEVRSIAEVEYLICIRSSIVEISRDPAYLHEPLDASYGGCKLNGYVEHTALNLLSRSSSIDIIMKGVGQVQCMCTRVQAGILWAVCRLRHSTQTPIFRASFDATCVPAFASRRQAFLSSVPCLALHVIH